MVGTTALLYKHLGSVNRGEWIDDLLMNEICYEDIIPYSCAQLFNVLSLP